MIAKILDLSKLDTAPTTKQLEFEDTTVKGLEMNKKSAIDHIENRCTIYDILTFSWHCCCIKENKGGKLVITVFNKFL